MNTTFTKEELAKWVKGLIAAAKEDTNASVFWFGPTQNSPLAIVGGWEGGFSAEYAYLLCLSKADPTYAMCVKIVDNSNGPAAYTDFDMLPMPVNAKPGEVEDNCIVLECKDDPANVAEFFMTEWDRLMKKNNK